MCEVQSESAFKEEDLLVSPSINELGPLFSSMKNNVNNTVQFSPLFSVTAPRKIRFSKQALRLLLVVGVLTTLNANSGTSVYVTVQRQVSRDFHWKRDYLTPSTVPKNAKTVQTQPKTSAKSSCRFNSPTRDLPISTPMSLSVLVLRSDWLRFIVDASHPLRTYSMTITSSLVSTTTTAPLPSHLLFLRWTFVH